MLKVETGSDNIGLTLIELMIAMAILSIGILGVASMQISATKGNTSAHKSTLLNNIASNWVEMMVRASYDSPLLEGGTSGDYKVHTSDSKNDKIDNDLDGLVDEPDETGDDHTHQIHIRWEVADDLELENTKSIIVTVSRGKGMSRKAVTMQYNRSLYN